MERPFDCLAKLAVLFFLLQSLYGCPSFRIQKVNDGADVPRPPQEFAIGKTTLADVLKTYGAPVGIADMEGSFSLVYQKILYRGGQFSIGVPLSDVLKIYPSFETAGNLQRYDSAVFVFTQEGVLSDMVYQKETDRPIWNTYWK
jgi:hypothetical protein